MKKIFKLSTLVLAMTFMFSIFSFNEAKAEGYPYYTIDGGLQAGDNTLWVDALVTHNLWTNSTGGTKLGTISPQRLYNPTEAWVLVSTYVGDAWIYYGSWSDLYYNFSVDMYYGYMTIFDTRTLYNYNSQKIGALGPQNNIRVKQVSFKVPTYVGPAWTIFNPEN